MGFSPLADMSRRIPDVGRSQPRQSNVAGVLVHHNAGVNAYDQATAAGREVSANYWITNEGVLLPNIDEERRAFTSGHISFPEGAKADHRFITVEVSNDGGPGWSISAAAKSALEGLIGDVHARYGLGQVHRGYYTGVAVHRDFVSTECPGGYILDHLPEIIFNAELYRTGGATPVIDKDKPVAYITKNTNSRKKNQTVGKESVYLQFKEGESAITTVPGDYELTSEIRLKGEPGDILRAEAHRYIWDAASASYSSQVYINGERIVLDEHGLGHISFPVSNRVPADGSRLGIKLEVLHGKTVEVTRHAIKGHQWDV